MVPRLTCADKVLVAASVCLIVVSYVVVNTAAGRGSEVLIEVDGKTAHKTSLREEHVITLHGAHGELSVETRAGKVAITHAECHRASVARARCSDDRRVITNSGMAADRAKRNWRTTFLSGSAPREICAFLIC